MQRLDGIVSRELARAMTLAATCTSRDDSRAVLNHVHVARRGEQLIVEASDTYRLALVQMPAPAARWLQPDEGDDWLLPGAVIASAMSTKRARAAALLAIDGDEIAAGGGDAITITEAQQAGRDEQFPSAAKYADLTGWGEWQMPLMVLADAARFAARAVPRDRMSPAHHRLWISASPAVVAGEALVQLTAFRRLEDLSPDEPRVAHLAAIALPCPVVTDLVEPTRRAYNAELLLPPLALAHELLGDRDAALLLAQGPAWTQYGDTGPMAVRTDMGGGASATIVVMALAQCGLDLQPGQIDALGLTTARFPEWVG